MINLIINGKEKIELESCKTLKEILKLEKKNLNFTNDIVCAYINNKLVDINYEVTEDVNVEFINCHDEKSRDVLRHSCAHLLAHAVKILYPNTQISIGPVIKDGFYYDFLFEKKITEENLKDIESKMIELSNKDILIEKHFISRKDAYHIFQGEKYKIEILKKIDDKSIISYYKQDDFIDLCNGPHVPSTKYLKYFKLLKISGAYWQGNSKNEMLQRIYGTAWEKENELNSYLNYLKEVKFRDHKKIGLKLNLFNFNKDAPGVVFWNPKGWIIYNEIIKYIRNILNKSHYQEIKTPTMLNLKLFEKSGHLEKFSKNMFIYKDKELNSVPSLLKPMSCPCHVQFFNSTPKSYKDLPYRVSEFGSCYRNELTGALYGLMRLKNFTQDDGHIFCNEDQIKDEVILFIKTLEIVYSKFNFNKFSVKLSKRPNDYIGTESLWDFAEKTLKDSIENLNINYTTTNDGAFYGPKLEFLLKDSLGREWQCGTIQLDLFTSKSLNAKYMDNKSNIRNPVILHRAILGSIERFVGILIEDTNGNFPFWLSPIQIVIININNKNNDYIYKIYDILNVKYRTQLDLKQESVDFKIRNYTLQKIPYILIIGDNESKNNTITVRELNNKNTKDISINAFMNNIDSMTYE